ncbi:hypothetical protein SO694_00004347 [Aureococcus anophagefferens]|uniref:TPX2 C-terminal domain-containing protein n=1 Tax=Aureococcus anophagefferens TaxID=44056 RepID=A0ABR1G919_AURAN
MHSLPELVAEQGRLAPFRRDVRICWEFLEREIRAAKAREDKERAAARPATRPKSAHARSRSPPPRSRSPPPRPRSAHARSKSPVKARRPPPMEAKAPDPARCRPAAPARRRPSRPSRAPRRRRPTGSRASAASSKTRVSRTGRSRRRSAVADARARGRLQVPTGPRGEGGEAPAAVLEFRPRWGAGDPSPSTKRLKEKKEKLAKYSGRRRWTPKSRARARPQELAAEDARRLGEARAMREEDRSALERRFFEVGREPVFFMKARSVPPERTRSARHHADAAEASGDFTAAATRDWRPAADDGGALRTSFIGALKEAKSTDARLLDDLISGYAPGQLRPRPRSAAAPRSTPKALSRLRSGSAKRPPADVDANVARARSYEPKRDAPASPRTPGGSRPKSAPSAGRAGKRALLGGAAACFNGKCVRN